MKAVHKNVDSAATIQLILGNNQTLYGVVSGLDAVCKLDNDR
jgi:hypothetical protein